MRLWHYLLLPYLPKNQLLAQWRELNSIFKKEDKHILINYIYKYDKYDLNYYAKKVVEEMERRGYKVNTDNAKEYFKNCPTFLYSKDFVPFKNHHNFRYLTQCFYNLQEKYDRGQVDFDEETYNKLKDFYSKEFAKGVI